MRTEAGSEEALALLRRHLDKEAAIAVDTLFFYEVVRTVSRYGTYPGLPERVWGDLKALELFEVALEDATIEAASKAQQRLGCSLYDAFPAGLADLLDVPLYSADARAHGKQPSVRIIG